jgi:hypothetical protein
MAMAAGAKLGAYEIPAPIGAGGMGEGMPRAGCQAEARRALKVLTETFAHNPDRLTRFQHLRRSHGFGTAGRLSVSRPLPRGSLRG